MFWIIIDMKDNNVYMTDWETSQKASIILALCSHLQMRGKWNSEYNFITHKQKN